MQTAREKIVEVVLAQPEDATYEEIVRELAFERMIERSMNDARSGRVISDEEMSRRIPFSTLRAVTCLARRQL